MMLAELATVLYQYQETEYTTFLNTYHLAATTNSV